MRHNDIIPTSLGIDMRWLIILLAIIFARPVFADDIWKMVESPGMQIAVTSNDTGSATGVICVISTNSCSAYIFTNTKCEENASYPMMVNSPIGASTINTKCLTIGKVQYFIVDEFLPMISAYESGGEIGFAVPLQNGQFRVIRFKTLGATSAIKAARTSPENKPAVSSDRVL